MASPHLAGVAALMFAYNFSATDEVKNALYSSVQDLYESGYDSTSGYGLVQAYNALLAGGEEPTDTPLAAPTGLDPANGDENVSVNTSFSWSAVEGAEGYRIKIGVDLNEPEFQADILAPATSYDPGDSLDFYGTVYDWSVQAYRVTDGVEETATTTVSFTTESAPEDECVPTANNEKGPRGSDGEDNDCDGLIDGDDPF